MIIDISSYNGKINFEEMAAKEKIERVILRGTTKNGNIDVRFFENLNGVCKSLDTSVPVDVYKFSYAKTYGDAAVEAYNLIETLKNGGAYTLINTIWLDLEAIDGKEHTKAECEFIIAAYKSVCKEYNARLGIYCSYSYLKNLIPRWAQSLPIWLARWGAQMGDCYPFKVQLWQYTNKGQCAGIKGDVDLSKAVD